MDTARWWIHAWNTGLTQRSSAVYAIWWWWWWPWWPHSCTAQLPTVLTTGAERFCDAVDTGTCRSQNSNIICWWVWLLYVLIDPTAGWVVVKMCVTVCQLSVTSLWCMLACVYCICQVRVWLYDMQWCMSMFVEWFIDELVSMTSVRPQHSTTARLVTVVDIIIVDIIIIIIITVTPHISSKTITCLMVLWVSRFTCLSE